LRDVTHLVGQVAAHGVDGVGQVLPRSGNAGHDGLTAKLAVGADFARHARHFRSEGTQLVHHRVDGFLELKDLAAHVHSDFLGKIAVGDGDGDFGDVAHLSGQVARHRVHAFGKVLPHARHFAHLRLAAEFAFGTDFARDARHFRSEHAQLLDHRVHDTGGFKEFALERAAIDLQPDCLQQIALCDGSDGGRDFFRWPEQVVDQCIDRGFHLVPCAVRDAEFYAMSRLAFAPHDLANALELLRHPFIGGDDVVEGVRNLPEDAVLLDAHSYGKVAGAHRAERLQQILQFDGGVCVCSIVRRAAGALFCHAIGRLLGCYCLIHRRLPNNPHRSGAAECTGSL
jgi:hypothetical protein